MTERTVPCEHCGRKFADSNDVRQHTRHRHPSVKLPPKRKGDDRRARRAAMQPDDAYAFVDSLDLPDGAHWAMLEEMTGLEPADFANIGVEE